MSNSLSPPPIRSDDGAPHISDAALASLAAPSGSSPPTPGPCSRPPELPRSIVLPAKPKPGRKPATDVPADKRKASNREAQRKFRERRRRKLEEAVADAEHERDKTKKMSADLEQRDERVEALSRELEIQRSQRTSSFGEPLQPIRAAPPSGRPLPPLLAPLRLPSFSTPSGNTNLQPRPSTSPSIGSGISPGTVLPGALLPLPPPSEPQRRPSEAQTFTHFSPPPLKTEHSNPIVSSPPPPPQPTYPLWDNMNAMEIDFTSRSAAPVAEPIPDCGFCTGDTYCICQMKDKVHSPPSQPALPTFEPPTSASGPGSCDACARDPQRRQVCIAMSERSEQVPRSPFFPSSTLAPIREEDLQNSRDSFMSCTTAMNTMEARIPDFRTKWPKLVDSLRVASPAEAPCDDCDSQADEDGRKARHSHQDVEVASILSMMQSTTKYSSRRLRDSGYSSLTSDSEMMDAGGSDMMDAGEFQFVEVQEDL